MKVVTFNDERTKIIYRCVVRKKNYYFVYFSNSKTYTGAALLTLAKCLVLKYLVKVFDTQDQFLDIKIKIDTNTFFYYCINGFGFYDFCSNVIVNNNHLLFETN